MCDACSRFVHADQRSWVGARYNSQARLEMTMEQRLSLVTLGVRDLARAIAFYRGLGWEPSAKVGNGAVAFFQLGGIVFALFGWDDLAEDAGIAPAGDGFGAIALAYNTRVKDDVDHVLAEAEALGAKILKPARETFWGGYSGCFADLDGHVWEVAWNPFFPISDTGETHLPG